MKCRIHIRTHVSLILVFLVISYDFGKGITCDYLSPVPCLESYFGQLFHWFGYTNVIIVRDPAQNKHTKVANRVQINMSFS